MSEDLHNIDDLFKSALGNNEEEPSSTVWEDLDRKLDKRTVVAINNRYQRLKWVAAASLIFSFAAGMYTVYTKQFYSHILQSQSAITKSPNGAVVPKKIATAMAADETNHSNVSSATQPKNITTQPMAAAFHKTKSNSDENSNSFIPESKIQTATAGVINPATLSSSSSKENFINSNSQVEDQPFYKTDVLQSLAVLPNSNASFSSPAQINLTNTNNLLANTEQQSSATTNKVYKKQTGKLATPAFTISVLFSPDVLFNHVINDKKVFREDDKNEIIRSEKAGFSSSIGALLSYNFNSKWSVQSGITFSNEVNKIEKKHVYARPDNRGNVRYRFNCTAGYSYVDIKSGTTPAYGDSLPALHSTSTLQYVGIPLGVQYSLRKNKWSVTPGVALSANILTKGQIETFIATGTNNERAKTRDIRALKSMYLSASAVAGVGYKLNRKLSLNVIPQVRFGINSINTDGPVKTYKNSFGIAGGLSLSL